MNISVTPGGIIDVWRPRQGAADLHNAGFFDVVPDIAEFCKPQEWEFFGKERKYKSAHPSLLKDEALLTQQVRNNIACYRQAGLTVTVVFAPFLQDNTKRDDLNDLLEKYTKLAVSVAEENECKYIVVRPLHTGFAKEDAWQVNREFYLRLAKNLTSTKILLVNRCRDINGHLVRGLCSDGFEAARFIDELNDAVGAERFGFCMDIGTATTCGQNIYDFIVALGQRLYAVVLRDSDGYEDSKLLPFTAVAKRQSKTDWLNVVRGLRAVHFDGQIILNCRDTLVAFSPLLKPYVLTLAKHTVDFIMWQIGMEQLLAKYNERVLFGAGNMCRAYMKCYGETYPPLFTCDNNEKLWGTEFCGLTVKNPQELKNLPTKCAIFICNIYYREIEKQLRDMDIMNPIELAFISTGWKTRTIGVRGRRSDDYAWRTVAVRDKRR